MGNREDLLAGAKRCLLDKGYARTTARDIATEAGVSLAAIGYHYGSKEVLLNAALAQATEEWGGELAKSLATRVDPAVAPVDRFEAIWAGVIESFEAHRGLWAATFEVLGQVEHVPQLREQLAVGLREAQTGLAHLFHDLDPVADGPRARAVGAFHQALLTGLMSQLLIDPDNAPSARDLAESMRYISS
ncbi:TetR/AcrR family transcriptional regulator [Umezawaea tangerina]|uniref:TetR family transcriptional regulator n=1 Tax=Umezawaea tangerina TaxID=84725 RepID=A0A2T0SRQ9_9PSEU|nr:TetR/AcrR family transcriptional regulator [Umezawaea tangerina]PRY36094.1 TetR family transcriptional regulator [Umezawaea tangerina]